MSAVPVRKRQREEQVVPTFDVPKESAVVASVDVESGGGGVGLGGGSGGVGGGVADSDYPIPNFEVLYAEMRHPERGVKSDDRRWRLLTYPKCFVGQEMVDWLMEHVDGEIDRAEAVRLGQKLLDAGIMHHVTKSEPFADEYYFYRFQEDEQTSILNMKKLWDSNRRVRHAVDVAQEAITRLACLCEEHRRKVLLMQVSRGQNVSEKDPEDIDYALLAKSDAFRQYALSSAELQCVDIQSLTTDERLAFFINIYNALCLHGHVVFGAPTNFLKRISFFRGMAYRLGGLDYTLDDIEHGILRGNKRPPSLRFMQQLRPSDPKCQFILTVRESRIHFVISAGTPSDPPIRIVDMENLEDELHDATEEFLNKTVKVEVVKKEVTVPRIFSWYSEDFPRPEIKMLRWILSYLRDDLYDALSSLIDVDGAVPTVIYQNFDWTNSEARFNSAVVRRKRRRLEREIAIANGDKSQLPPGLISPELTYSPAIDGSSGSFGSPQMGSLFNANTVSPDISRRGIIGGAGSGVDRTPPLRSFNGQQPIMETPALSGASYNYLDREEDNNDNTEGGNSAAANPAAQESSISPPPLSKT